MHNVPELTDEVAIDVDLGLYRDNDENDLNMRQVNPLLAAGRKRQQLIIRTYFS